jgi:hypothetical protein
VRRSPEVIVVRLFVLDMIGAKQALLRFKGRQYINGPRAHIVEGDLNHGKFPLRWFARLTKTAAESPRRPSVEAATLVPEPKPQQVGLDGSDRHDQAVIVSVSDLDFFGRKCVQDFPFPPYRRRFRRRRG